MIFFFAHPRPRRRLGVGRSSKGARLIITSHLHQLNLQFRGPPFQSNNVTVLLPHKLRLLGKPLLLGFQLLLQKQIRLLQYVELRHVGLRLRYARVGASVGKVSY